MKNLETMSNIELNNERVRLAKMNWKEYTTRGNTQRCQELFSEIEKIDKELDRRRA